MKKKDNNQYLVSAQSGFHAYKYSFPLTIKNDKKEAERFSKEYSKKKPYCRIVIEKVNQ